jgi:hypothetical protein
MRAISDNNVKSAIQHDVIGPGFFNGTKIGRKLENFLAKSGTHRSTTILNDVVAFQDGQLGDSWS